MYTTFYNNSKPYYSFYDYVKGKYGLSVGKISIDSNFGCEHKSNNGGCIFCNLKSYKPNYTIEGDSIEQWKNGLIKCSERYKKFYAYFQLGTPLSKSFADNSISIASTLIKDDNCVGIMFGARCDMLDDNILSKLDKLAKDTGKEIWLEVGIQSSHEKTLQYINRCESYSSIKSKIIHIDKNYKYLLVCGHIIFGLPYDNGLIETNENMIETVKQINDLPIAAVKYHHLQIVENTKIEKLYNSHPFNTLDYDSYLNLITKVIGYTSKQIIISRLVGNSHIKSLIAPRWGKSKTHMLTSIDRVLKAERITQGCYL